MAKISILSINYVFIRFYLFRNRTKLVLAALQISKTERGQLSSNWDKYWEQLVGHDTAYASFSSFFSVYFIFFLFFSGGEKKKHLMPLLPMLKSARNIHRSWFILAKALWDKNLSNQIKNIKMSYCKGQFHIKVN